VANSITSPVRAENKGDWKKGLSTSSKCLPWGLSSFMLSGLFIRINLSADWDWIRPLLYDNDINLEWLFRSRGDCLLSWSLYESIFNVHWWYL